MVHWDDDTVAMRLGRRTAGGLVVGATWGSFLAFMRSESIGLYATTMSTNFAIGSFAYFGTREAVAAVWPHSSSVERSVAAGVISGGVLTSVFAGPLRGLAGAVLWGAGGYVGQLAYDAFADWRASQAQAIIARREAAPQLTPRQLAKQQALEEQARAQAMRLGPHIHSAESQSFAKSRLPPREVPVMQSDDVELFGFILPKWLPIHRVDPQSTLVQAKQRLADVEMLILAHEAAVRKEAEAEAAKHSAATPSSSAPASK